MLLERDLAFQRRCELLARVPRQDDWEIQAYATEEEEEKLYSQAHLPNKMPEKVETPTASNVTTQVDEDVIGFDCQNFIDEDQMQ